MGGDRMREAEISRKTAETEITVRLNIDGGGNSDIETGIGFFDHMLRLFSKHSLIDLEIRAKGDLEVDAHHTVEDVAIVLGQALKKAIGDGVSIKRYGSAVVPMDEALVMVAVDAGGRPYLSYDIDIPSPMLGGISSDLVEEFFRAISWNAMMNIHMKMFYGSNSHHIAEAAFKAFGRAIGEALMRDDRIKGVLSTKGCL
jgi:imidazoleglycerol-phosphate dehydratase